MDRAHGDQETRRSPGELAGAGAIEDGYTVGTLLFKLQKLLFELFLGS